MNGRRAAHRGLRIRHRPWPYSRRILALMRMRVPAVPTAQRPCIAHRSSMESMLSRPGWAVLLTLFLLLPAWASVARGEWQQFYSEDGGPEFEVRGIFQDTQGRIWFHNEGANRYPYGIKLYDGLRWMRQDVPCAGDYTRLIGDDGAGHAWFAYTSSDSLGLTYRYDGTRCTAFVLPLHTRYGPPTATKVLEDRQGRLWFGTSVDTVYRFDGRSWFTLPLPPAGLPQFSSTTALFEDSRGRLWIGTRHGLFVYDGVTLRGYHESDGLYSEDVNAIAEDFSGAIWIGTNYGGVARFDGVRWETTVD